ncbi:MAG: sortase [bacterium]
MLKPKLILYLLIVIASLSLIVGGSWFLLRPVVKETAQAQNSSSSQASSLNSSTQVLTNQGSQTSDAEGEELTYQLSLIGLRMGYISSQSMLQRGLDLPLKKPYALTKDDYRFTGIKKLDQIIQAPQIPEKKSWLSYPSLGIEVPIVYSSLEDLFQTNQDGSLNFTKPIEESRSALNNGNYESTTYQQKLTQGVLHLAYSPTPGELGNSYIVGHSSNYTNVQSNYNEIFAPMVQKSQPGDKFTIYDNEGRKLNFKVFEALPVGQKEVNVAYKSYDDRRVVTLQASILTKVGNSWQPTQRWLTRGELEI